MQKVNKGGISLQWRHNGCDGVSNHQPHDYLLNRLFGRRSTKTSKLRVIGLCAGNSPGTGEFPAQMASNAENVSIWWHHHFDISPFPCDVSIIDWEFGQTNFAANDGTCLFRLVYYMGLVGKNSYFKWSHINFITSKITGNSTVYSTVPSV